jgi:hypothetical protein
LDLVVGVVDPRVSAGSIQTNQTDALQVSFSHRELKGGDKFGRRKSEMW